MYTKPKRAARSWKLLVRWYRRKSIAIAKFHRKQTPFPPFTEETAIAKVQAAEYAWNSRNPERVVLAYTEDSEWRNRAEFLGGREAIKAFLYQKWAKELDYRLKKELWCFAGDRIAVRFEYEWHDDSGFWFRSYFSKLTPHSL